MRINRFSAGIFGGREVTWLMSRIGVAKRKFIDNIWIIAAVVVAVSLLSISFYMLFRAQTFDGLADFMGITRSTLNLVANILGLVGLIVGIPGLVVFIIGNIKKKY